MFDIFIIFVNGVHCRFSPLGLDMPKITEQSILLPELQQCLSHLHLPIQKGERRLEKE